MTMTRLSQAALATLLILTSFLASSIAVGTGALGSVLAQTLTTDPRAVSLTAADLRPGFRVDEPNTGPEERPDGIAVYKANFVRERTPANVSNGPVQINSFVARTADAQQAAEQFASTRRAFPESTDVRWTEIPVARLGDESAGFSSRGNLTEGPGAAHLFLLRRGMMIVAITVTGLEKVTQMGEAEALAAVVLRRIDPSAAAARATDVPRVLNTPPPDVGTGAASASPGARSAATATRTPTAAASSGSGRPAGGSVRVANTGGEGLNLRASPATTAEVVALLPDGTVLELIGEDRQVAGRTWRNVRAPNSGTGWVAGEFVVPVSAATASPAAATATPARPTPVPTPTATPAGGTAQPTATRAATANPGATTAPTPAGGGATPTAAGATPGASGQTGASEVLDVNVTPQLAEVGQENQTITIRVTRGGQPVANAQATIEVVYADASSQSVTAPATGADGMTSATWAPNGPAGVAGVGVLVLAPDGASGTGGASFTRR